jgi:NAD(P)H-flavin reductase
LYVKGIFGKFVLQQTDLPKVFIGTWTWLSPLINMAIHCDVKEKTLFYSVPYQKDLFYEDKIKRIHDLTYEIYLTREDVKWYKFGRLDLKKLAFTKNTEFYVCGNPSIVDQIVQELRSLWYQHIFSEKF